MDLNDDLDRLGELSRLLETASDEEAASLLDQRDSVLERIVETGARLNPRQAELLNTTRDAGKRTRFRWAAKRENLRAELASLRANKDALGRLRPIGPQGGTRLDTHA